MYENDTDWESLAKVRADLSFAENALRIVLKNLNEVGDYAMKEQIKNALTKLQTSTKLHSNLSYACNMLNIVKMYLIQSEDNHALKSLVIKALDYLNN